MWRMADNIDQVLIDAATVRTKFYDEFFLGAADAGVEQVVILASGLDSRAYRLPWPTAGFDPVQPTAWSAEGLLGYLPPEAQDRLLDTITELSAPGSRLATESSPNPQPGEEDKMKEHMHRISQRWGAHGFDPDMAGLVYFGERNEAAPYLIARGWALNGINIRELFATNGLPPLEDDNFRFGETLFVSGTLNKTTNK